MLTGVHKNNLMAMSEGLEHVQDRCDFHEVWPCTGDQQNLHAFVPKYDENL